MSLYLPLRHEKKEIRILTLLPAPNATEPILCGLETISLDEAPEYEALSYVWGEMGGTFEIVLCGRPQPVTKNLFSALQALRYQEQPRKLWVDAVCINQDDLDERGSQVALMGFVYSQCVSVPIWLGHESALVRAVLEYHQRTDGEGHFDKFPAHLLECLHGWWSRVWTVQEGMLGPKIELCTARETCSIEQLERFVDAARRHLFVGRTCCKEVADSNMGMSTAIGAICVKVQKFVHDRTTIRKSSSNLLDLMLEYNGRDATDPRDKMFAFIGLLPSVPAGLINYKMPLEECIINVSYEIISTTDSLKLLCYRDIEPRESHRRYRPQILKSLPSWCPDWSQRMDSESLLVVHKYASLRTYYSAAAESVADATIHDGRYLGVVAIQYDAIREVGEFDELPERLTPFVKDWCDMVARQLTTCNSACDGCGRRIFGVRHKCQTCSDFDYCGKCIRDARLTHPDHSFSRIVGSEVYAQDARSLSSPTIDEHQATEAEESISTVSKMESHIVEPPESVWNSLMHTEYCFREEESLQDAMRRTLMGNKKDLWWVDGELDLPASSLLAFEEIVFALFWAGHVELAPFTGLQTRNQRTAELARSLLSHFTEMHVGLLYTQIHSATFKKRMMVTERGHIGLACAGARAGDRIAVLKGGPVPFILRPAVLDDASSSGVALEGRPEEYRLTGESYVHGIMNGEVMELLDSGALTETRVLLR